MAKTAERVLVVIAGWQVIQQLRFQPALHAAM